MTDRRVISVKRPQVVVPTNSACHKRLMHDWKEVKQNPLPMISADILNNNLCYWHCNIVGPRRTRYENCVFHISMTFPSNYPSSPPEINVLHYLAHPNVHNNRICLDMTDGISSGPYTGWSSAYTIQSILVQLQSFLFDENLDDIDPSDIELAVRGCKEFKCTDCEHIPNRPWPKITMMHRERDDVDDDDEVQGKGVVGGDKSNVQKTILDSIKEELICFHTKVPYNVKPIGIGLSVKRNPRSNAIQSITTSTDYLSIYAYNNLKIRKTAYNKPFGYWLPLYINSEHGPKAMKLAKKAISLISTGKVDQFEHKMVLEVLPSAMSSLIVELSIQKTYSSIKVLDTFCALHHLLLKFALEYPDLIEMADKKVRNFINMESARHKDIVPNLGEFFCLLMLSNVTWDEFKMAYQEESMHRSVFWILSDYPALNKTTPDPEIDKERIEKSFASSGTGGRLLMIYLYFIQHIAKPKGSTIEQVASQYDSLCGRPRFDLVESLQEYIHTINKKKINSFHKLFKEVGYPAVTDEKLLEMLRNAVSMSKKKQYHGQRDPAPTAKMRHEHMLNQIVRRGGQYHSINWKTDYNFVFKYEESLDKKFSSWRQYFFHTSIQFYISKILPKNPDWNAFSEFLKQFGDLETLHFSHNFPSNSLVKSPELILVFLLTNLTNIKTLVVEGGFKSTHRTRLERSLSYTLNKIKDSSSIESIEFSVVSFKKENNVIALFKALQGLKQLKKLVFNSTSLPVPFENLKQYLPSQVQQYVNHSPILNASYITSFSSLQSLDLSIRTPSPNAAKLFDSLVNIKTLESLSLSGQIQLFSTLDTEDFNYDLASQEVTSLNDSLITFMKTSTIQSLCWLMDTKAMFKWKKSKRRQIVLNKKPGWYSETTALLSSKASTTTTATTTSTTSTTTTQLSLGKLLELPNDAEYIILPHINLAEAISASSSLKTLSISDSNDPENPTLYTILTGKSSIEKIVITAPNVNLVYDNFVKFTRYLLDTKEKLSDDGTTIHTRSLVLNERLKAIEFAFPSGNYRDSPLFSFMYSFILSSFPHLESIKNTERIVPFDFLKTSKLSLLSISGIKDSTRSKGMVELCECLSVSPSVSTLTSLSLPDFSVTVSSIPVLCSLLQKLVNLEVLNLHGNKLGSQGVKQVSRSLLNHKKLTTLNLSYNACKDMVI
eukprot:TRINITY_DN443_c0_g1_i1.p1 TRINITY_DN443_c0_g1~~TRINITY_DN443_c0_g1_i1.p1  ORF type:complete len:1172 (+),score=270.57 TRINITY_DN443_c0_g1_i1:16-3531(+)